MTSAYVPRLKRLAQIDPTEPCTAAIWRCLQPTRSRGHAYRDKRLARDLHDEFRPAPRARRRSLHVETVPPDEALEWYEKARALAKLCGDAEKEGIHVLNLANLFAKQAEYPKALSLYAEARDLLNLALPAQHRTLQILVRNEKRAQDLSSPAGQ